MQFEVGRVAADLEEESGHRLDDVFEADDWTGLITWHDAVNAHFFDVEFGSHTVDHIRLTFVDRSTARDQLERSREMIEARTRRSCRHLAYPNGSFNAEVAELARECGYTCAVTTVEGLNRVGDDLLMLRRIPLPAKASPTELLFELSGLSGKVGQVRQWLGRAV
jgi:peptidoglycan/xylan/chitin deacetylase (PgdA/CDA1 family)